MLNPFASAAREDVMCTVRVVNTFENLAAHVELDDGVTVEPGDEVLVHGKKSAVVRARQPVEAIWANESVADWLK